MDQPNAEEREPDTGIAVLCHLAALSMYIGVPFGNILGPLIVWLLGRSRSTFVDDQGKEALNFQISFLVYGMLLVVGIGVLALATVAAFAGFFVDRWFAFGGVGLLIVTAVVLAVLHFILIIVAAVQASSGKRFRYPLTLRLVR